MNSHNVLANLDQYIEKDRLKFEKKEKLLDELTGMMLYVRNDVLPESLKPQFDLVPFSKAPLVLEKLGAQEAITKELARIVDKFQSKEMLDNITLKTTETLYKQTNDLLWLRDNQQEMAKESVKRRSPSAQNDLDFGH